MKLDSPILFLATDNAPETKRFYEETLGLNLIADEPFALVFRVGNMILRIQKMDEFTPQTHTVFGWQVDDIYEFITSLTSKHVMFETYPHLEQDDKQVWQSPGGAYIAWFKDPTGNILSLTQF